MDEIFINMLGIPTVKYNNQEIHFPYKKAAGLFYYMCICKKSTREELINIFWADSSEKSARKNLRDALYKIRKTFNYDVLISPIKSVIELNNNCLFIIDTDNITASNTLDIYKGDFLEGFNIKNCYEFESWMLEKRDNFKSIYIKSIHNKLHEMVNIGDMKKIESLSNILINYDPYNEKFYRDIMKIHALKGNYNKAIKLYHNLTSLLNEELHVEAEKSTKLLYKEILELKDTSSMISEKSSYFYGRYNELYKINENINNFINNSGTSMIITGEAGIGKTCLVNKLVQTLPNDNLYVFKSNCYKAEENFFLKSWYSIFSSINELIKKEKINIPNSWKSIISLIFPNFSNDNIDLSYDFVEYIDTTKFQIATEAIVNLFKKLIVKKKIIIIFDDIQWMDEMSKVLLSNILLQLAPQNIMLICTNRDDFEEKLSIFTIPLMRNELLNEIKLNRFSYNETKDITKEFLVGKDVNNKLINNIYKDTEGNPLFLMEMLKVINEKGYTKELSSKAANIIKSRIIYLDDNEKKLLNAISMFFDRVNIEKLKLLIKTEELEIFDIIESLQAKHLIKEVISENDIYYSFTHQKIREYVYNSQSYGKKKILHKKICEFLEKKLINNGEDKFIYPNLIYHFERCGNIKKAVKYKIKNLSEYYSISHETFPIFLNNNFKIQSKEIIFNVEEKLMHIDEQLNTVQDDSCEYKKLKMELEYLFGRYYIRIGEYSSGLKNIDASMNLACLFKDEKYLLYNYKQMIYYGIQVHDMTTMHKYINSSLEVIEKTDNIEEKGTLLRLKGLYFIKIKDYDNAKKLLNESINIFENLNKMQNKYFLAIAAGYNYIGQIYKYNSQFNEAYDYYSKAIKICEKNHINKGLYIFYTNAGQVLYEIGEYEKSEYYINKSLKLFSNYNDYWGLGMAEGYAALLSINKKDLSKANLHLKKAEKIAKKFNNPRALNLVERVKKELKKY